jgi:hypothetical protein
MKNIKGRGITWNDLTKGISTLQSDMDNMYERWLRVEHKYDCISEAQKRINRKTDIVITLQLLILILIGVTL